MRQLQLVFCQSAGEHPLQPGNLIAEKHSQAILQGPGKDNSLG